VGNVKEVTRLKREIENIKGRIEWQHEEDIQNAIRQRELAEIAEKEMQKQVAFFERVRNEPPPTGRRRCLCGLIFIEQNIPDHICQPVFVPCTECKQEAAIQGASYYDSDSNKRSCDNCRHRYNMDKNIEVSQYYKHHLVFLTKSNKWSRYVGLNYIASELIPHYTITLLSNVIIFSYWRT